MSAPPGPATRKSYVEPVFPIITIPALADWKISPLPAKLLLPVKLILFERSMDGAVIAPEERVPMLDRLREASIHCVPPIEREVAKSGAVSNTRSPVPVVPVTEARRFAAVIVETRTFEPSVATKREAVRLESVTVPVTPSVPPTEALPVKDKVVPR